MKTAGYFITTLLVTLAVSVPAGAQSIEDALRISQPPQYINARSSAMGNAFIGVADDFSALYWNPAGLGQLRESEFSLGLTSLTVKNNASFLNFSTSFDDGTTHLNNLGIVLPFPVSRGSFVLAAGYNRLNNFTLPLSTEGYNPFSSIQRSLYNPDDEDQDLAWKLGLEDTLVLTLQETGRPGWEAIFIDGDVYQMQEVFETGNLGQWSFGGSLEVARNLMLGLAFNILNGSYRFDRTFVETDPGDVHNGAIVGDGGSPGRVVERTDFRRLDVRQTVNQDIAGWNLKLGMLYNVGSIARLGFSIQSPNSVTIVEDYSISGASRFATGSMSYDAPALASEYDVTTGWVFGFGASVSPLSFLRISGDVEFADASGIEFDNSSVFGLTSLNSDIKRKLRTATSFRGGMEVRVPSTDLFLRGGFGYSVSPWKDDPSDFDAKTISFGAAYLFDERFMLNASLASTTFKAFRIIYQEPNEAVSNDVLRINEDISRLAIMLSLGYRF